MSTPHRPMLVAPASMAMANIQQREEVKKYGPYYATSSRTGMATELGISMRFSDMYTGPLNFDIHWQYSGENQG